MTEVYPVNSVEEFWFSMVEGSAPIAMMKNNLPADEWHQKEQRALAYLNNTLTQVPTTLSCDAWLGYATKA